ncbi:MAG: CotH kinase family protein [Anaerolineales bacterium]|nr:CotH kinase family protein [Anaerolineales bacterium]
MTRGALRDLSYRFFEISIPVLFILATGVLVILNPSSGTGLAAPVSAANQIEVYTYAMPRQGWAPLTVYFSAFGSRSLKGSLIKYEWDLDANGRYDTDATASGGYTSYTYTKPGKYLVTLRVLDDLGNVAAANVLVTVRHPASSSVDYWNIFDDSQVRKVELRITQSEWDRMWLDPGSKTRVRADAVIFGELIQDIAVSMKGNSSLDGSGIKKSWKLDTNYYIPDQEFHNLKQLLFHNNFADASMLREKMAYDLMQFAGVPAGHTAYVEFWIDIVDDDQQPTYLGVYTMVERVDSKHVGNRFGRDSGIGNLYKADAWFEEGAADLAYYGEDIADYPRPRGEVAYGLQTNLDHPDYSDIINLCYVIDGAAYQSEAEFTQALEQVFDVDSYLRYLAVILTTLNLDTYPYTGNNYYLYHDPGTGKFSFVAWDLNNSWGHFGGDYDFPLYGEACCQGPLQWAPLFTRVFQVERYRRDYAAYVDLLVRGRFNGQDFASRAQAWQELVGPYLTRAAGDKHYFGASAMYTFDQFTQDRQSMVTLTARRSQYLLSVLGSDQWKVAPDANVKPQTGQQQP